MIDLAGLAGKVSIPAENWRTVELVLEGAVFLLRGLELSAIVGDVRADHAGLGAAAGIAAGALALLVLVRAAYVAPLLGLLKMQAGRGARMKPWIATAQDRLDDPDTAGETYNRFRHRRSAPSAEMIDRFRTRLRRFAADIDYLLSEPLGWREGTVVVWAGMRGAVTLAAAQTLPTDAPGRSLLVLVAFLVATGSLLLQGGTIPRLVGLVGPGGVDQAAVHDERVRLMALLDLTAAATRAEHGGEVHADHPVEPGGASPPHDDGKSLTLDVIAAQRRALLDAGDEGTFSAPALNGALAVLDADQIAIELKGAPTGRA